MGVPRNFFTQDLHKFLVLNFMYLKNVYLIGHTQILINGSKKKRNCCLDTFSVFPHTHK